MNVRLWPALVLAATILAPPAHAAEPILGAARDAEPVVLTGAQIPGWSRLPALGAPGAWPQGALDSVRSVHHGSHIVLPDIRTGVPTGEIAAYRWDGGRFVEIPIQVDERYPYFLANAASTFSLYSAVDEELNYAWDVERWAMTAGGCRTAYPSGVAPRPDPVPGLDDDDEVVFMASDGGDQAPANAPSPAGATSRQQVRLLEAGAPAIGRYVYLFRKPGGSSFDAGNGYVSYRRDANADEWIDRYSFTRDDPEALGISNRNYGANTKGPVCRTATGTGYPKERDGVPRQSTDRFPRDGVTVSTDTYEWHASGRWMIRSIRVAKPGQPRAYGPDLIDRWKGRAFQQSPDSEISLVGFEDEQVNWEANSALLGERVGPVRAIREIWGADSGTNTTMTETFYRDAISYVFHVRVHPVPPDGIYQNWDFNPGVVTRYFNMFKPDGVPVDGVPDDIGNIDDIAGMPAYFDIPDPTFGPPIPVLTWQQVSGRGDFGSLVSAPMLPKDATSYTEPLLTPYYRDDKCFDDGTGDTPVSRPWPGEDSRDPRVQAGYASAAGKPYRDVTCDEKQGAWGSHGIHYFVTSDTDNAMQSKPLTEIVGTEWQFMVPTSAPHSVGERYANILRLPLLPLVSAQ